MSTHTNPRRDKARKLAEETGCSVRTAYRKIAVKENRKFNQKAEYEVNKGKDV